MKTGLRAQRDTICEPPLLFAWLRNFSAIPREPAFSEEMRSLELADVSIAIGAGSVMPSVIHTYDEALSTVEVIGLSRREEGDVARLTRDPLKRSVLILVGGADPEVSGS